jgi:hypothetical protein
MLVPFQYLPWLNTWCNKKNEEWEISDGGDTMQRKKFDDRERQQ